MRAGRLKHRLIVERPDSTQDDTGAEIITWVLIAEVWAAIEPVKGREKLGVQILAQADTLIVIRWSPLVDLINAKWRLRHAEQRSPVIYNIAAPPVNVNMGQREIQLICTSGINQG